MKLIYSYHDSLGESGRSISAEEAYHVARQRPVSRPWVAMCMVASIDGSTVMTGGSAALSSAADRSVLLALRAAADDVVVGAGTVRAEGYGVPSKAGQRVAVVSHTGHLDFNIDLFTSGAGYVVAPMQAPELPVETLRAGTNEVDMNIALQAMSCNFIQLEGGAKLNALLTTADLVDEINLTISPQIIGGNGPRLTTNAPDLAQRFHLQHVLEDDGFLFLRYLRKR
ncbi:dihydrofolate reductase family protein [bacterium]|nr:dihydrofolate reductase family protein [bacterium]